MKVFVNDKYLSCEKIDKNFKIVNLSDIHFCGEKFIPKMDKLCQKLSEVKPDAIAISGDFIDSLDYFEDNREILADYIKRMASISPVFMSFGSHDLEFMLSFKNMDRKAKLLGEYFEFLKAIDSNFYPLLPDENNRVDLDENISVFGYSYGKNDDQNIENVKGDFSHIEKYFEDEDIDNERFNILLCHSASPFIKKGRLLDNIGFDLILSGHNHGAMLPHFLKNFPIGLVGPDKKIFPYHPAGILKSDDNTVLDISRGFWKVPGCVKKVIPLGEYIYYLNYLYANEFDLINIVKKSKELKRQVE